jgi:hypothetical protein
MASCSSSTRTRSAYKVSVVPFEYDIEVVTVADEPVGA